MGANLDQQLGELSGQLKAVIPTLERLEGRQAEGDKAAAAAGAREQGLRKEFDDFRLRVSARLGEHYRRMEKLERDGDRTAAATAGLVKKSEGMMAKLWEVAKLVVAAALGGLATWMLSGRR